LTVDLLLHLLSSICMLPVTKELVTSSRLGKLVSAVEKSKICVGTANEDTIKERVAKVKEQWSKVVKLLKHNVCTYYNLRLGSRTFTLTAFIISSFLVLT
jgi:hypothetical protein